MSALPSEFVHQVSLFQDLKHHSNNREILTSQEMAHQLLLECFQQWDDKAAGPVRDKSAVLGLWGLCQCRPSELQALDSLTCPTDSSSRVGESQSVPPQSLQINLRSHCFRSLGTLVTLLGHPPVWSVLWPHLKESIRPQIRYSTCGLKETHEWKSISQILSFLAS